MENKEIPIDKSKYLHGGNIVDESWSLVSVNPNSEVIFKYTLVSSENYPNTMSCTVRYQVVGLGDNEEETNETPITDSKDSEIKITELENLLEDMELDIEEEEKLQSQNIPVTSAIPSFFTIDEPLLQNRAIEKEPLVEGLRIEIEIENLEEKEAWVGVGTHLYFRNPFSDSVDSLKLALKVDGEVYVDEDTLIPPHPLEIMETIPLEHDFDGIFPRTIGPTEFDTCFRLDSSVLEDEEAGSPFVILKNENYMLEIIPEFTSSKGHKCSKDDPAIQYVQLYIPSNRDSIAIEPQTSVTNHFQHPYDPKYNNCILRNKGDKLVYSTLFIVTWSF